MALPANDPLYWTILLAAGQAVVNLALPGIGGNVYLQMLPAETGYNVQAGQVQDVVYPAVLLTCEGEVDELIDGDSESNQGIFPCRCWIADITDPNLAAKVQTYLVARKSLLNLFHYQNPGIQGVMSADVTPNVMFDPRLPQYQRIVSGMLLKFRWGQQRY